MADPESIIYQFKITLKESTPKIWRRVQVPKTYTFYDLHVVIQCAMGWGHSHLHQFMMKHPSTKKKVLIGTPDEDGWVQRINEQSAKIAQYFLTPKQKASYLYDMGDGWDHEVLLEKILPATVGANYPQCIDGKMACPPEDCGGISGYEYLKEIMANPQHEEYEDRKEWLEGDFDPVTFDPKAVMFYNPYGLCNLM